MAITATVPANGTLGSDTDGATFASGSVSFAAAGNLVLIAAHCQSTSGTPPSILNVTGASLTGAVALQDFNWSTEYRLSLWAAISTSSAGAITVSYPATVAGARAVVVEFANVHTAQAGPNMANGVIQLATGSGLGTAQAVTLPNALNDATNATFAVYGGLQADTRTAKAGWTEKSDVAFTPRTNADMETQFIAAGDVASQATSTISNVYGAIAVEIAQTGTLPPQRAQIRRQSPSIRALRGIKNLHRSFVFLGDQTIATTVTGTLATTNANDTSAGTGTTVVTGTLARTNANDTSAASGNSTITGSLAKTNANDTSAASGKPVVTGSSATTNANDTSAASGKPVVTGTSSTTNAADTSAASGTPVVTGTSATTNANDTCVASGTVIAASTTTTVEPTGGGYGARKTKTAFTIATEKRTREEDELLCLL